MERRVASADCAQAPGWVTLELWDEIRRKLVNDHEKEACKLLNENDAYGYNFHKGIVSGCNKLDIAIRGALQARSNHIPMAPKLPK